MWHWVRPTHRTPHWVRPTHRTPHWVRPTHPMPHWGAWDSARGGLEGFRQGGDGQVDLPGAGAACAEDLGNGVLVELSRGTPAGAPDQVREQQVLHREPAVLGDPVQRRP